MERTEDGEARLVSDVERLATAGDAATVIVTPSDNGGRPDASGLLDLHGITRIGRYTVMRKLGMGAMGVVFSAYAPRSVNL